MGRVVMDHEHDDALPSDPSTSAVQFIGPFELHKVVIEGWRVPYLSADMLNGGPVLLHLDGRFCVEMTIDEAERVIPFVADCIAVAAGYTCHPGTGEDRPAELIERTPYHRMFGI